MESWRGRDKVAKRVEEEFARLDATSSDDAFASAINAARMLADEQKSRSSVSLIRNWAVEVSAAALIAAVVAIVSVARGSIGTVESISITVVLGLAGATLGYYDGVSGGLFRRVPSARTQQVRLLQLDAERFINVLADGVEGR